MKRLGLLSAVLPSIAVVGFLVWWRGEATAGTPTPGATKPAAVIDAARFRHLQAALDAVPESGGLVKLPPGDFVLKSPLVLTRENTRVAGAGAATHLINRNRDGKPALVLRPPGQAAGRKGKIWRVQLADFRISGNPQSGDGLRAEDVNEIYLHGLSIDHNGGHGISLVDCYEDPRLCDSIITYNGRAGLNILRGHDIVVCGNQFEENQDALRCIDSFNLTMSGNALDDHLRHGVVIENTYGSVVSGNMIEECKGVAIVLDRDCYGNTLSANVIAHNFSGGVDLRDAWGCAVSANTFTMDTPFGVRVGSGAGRITVTGNNFSNAHIGGKVKRDDAAAGVRLEGTSDIVVSGNLFTGLAQQAVIADADCRRVAVTGNVMADLGRKATRKRPAIDLGGAKPVVVKDNIVPGTSAPNRN